MDEGKYFFGIDFENFSNSHKVLSLEDIIKLIGLHQKFGFDNHFCLNNSPEGYKIYSAGKLSRDEIDRYIEETSIYDGRIHKSFIKSLSENKKEAFEIFPELMSELNKKLECTSVSYSLFGGDILIQEPMFKNGDIYDIAFYGKDYYGIKIKNDLFRICNKTLVKEFLLDVKGTSFNAKITWSQVPAFAKFKVIDVDSPAMQ